MFGTPCIAHIDVSFFFWIWLYSIKPHETDRKKVRGLCGISTRGGKTMVHGATYAPTSQQINFRLQIALSALLGMYFWHTDVTNAFAKADHPEQIYYMLCNQVLKIGGRHRTLTPPPPDAVVPVLKDLQDDPGGPRLWAIKCHSALITIKFKNTTHALYLYHDIFNAEFVLLLRMVDAFLISCKLEDTYSKRCDLLNKNWQVPMLQ
jgi:hypothetical protein